MAAHACLKNEFTEDEKCRNLVRWLKCPQSSYMTGMQQFWCHFGHLDFFFHQFFMSKLDLKFVDFNIGSKSWANNSLAANLDILLKKFDQIRHGAAHVAEWLRLLIFSALNRLSSHWYGFEPCSGHVRQAKFCLQVVRCFFSGTSRSKMSEILTGHKTQIKKIRHGFCFKGNYQRKCIQKKKRIYMYKGLKNKIL